MAQMMNLSRFKRTITIEPRTYANTERVKIDPKTKVIRQIKSEVDVINKMLKALEEAGYENSYASKTLFRKLDTSQVSLVQNGRIDKSKITKDYSMTGLTYIKKSLNDFVVSKTSTVAGINKREEDSRSYIAELTDNPDFANSLTKEELDQLYSVFNDERYEKLTKDGTYSSTEIFSTIVEAKSNKTGIRNFMQTIIDHSEEYPDKEVREIFKGIYRKYVTNR